MEVIPSVHIIRDFNRHSAYISTQAQLIKKHTQDRDHLLFSYHGILERQIHKSSCKKICSGFCAQISLNNQGCYRAQCYQTSNLIAQELKLSPNQYNTSFQSRLGKIPRIKPYTDEILRDLIEKGVKNYAVDGPSFTADCIETLEEIGMRVKERWLNLGGKEFTIIPSLNSNQQWTQGIANTVQEINDSQVED